MGMNWSGFGGFAQGFANGINMGQVIKQAFKEDDRRKILEAGLAEAKSMQQRDIEKSVTDNGEPKAQAPAEGPKTGQVAPDTATTQTAAVPTPQTTVMPAGPAAGGIGTVSAPAPATAQPAAAPVAPVQGAPSAPVASAGLPPVGGAPAPGAEAQVAAATGVAGPQKRFTVGGQGFDTREEAVAAASKKAPSVTDYFYQTAVPKLQEWYVSNGDVENAAKLEEFVKSKRGEQAVKTFGTAMQKLMFTNDVNGGVQALGDYYNKYIDDGVDFTKGEVGADGKINITVKNKDSGTESVMSLTKGELVRMGMAHDPAQLFKMGLAQVEAQEKQSAELAKEDRKFRQDVAVKKMEITAADRRQQAGFDNDAKKAAKAHEYDLDKLGTAEDLKVIGARAQKKAEVQGKIDILKESGLSPDAIRELIPHMVGGDGYKKSTSPEEARRMLLTEHAKDPLFNSKPEKEKRAIIDQEMDVIYKPSTTTPQSKAAPATPSGTGGKRYYRDTVTGEIVLR